MRDAWDAPLSRRMLASLDFALRPPAQYCDLLAADVWTPDMHEVFVQSRSYGAALARRTFELLKVGTRLSKRSGAAALVEVWLRHVMPRILPHL